MKRLSILAGFFLAAGVWAAVSAEPGVAYFESRIFALSAKGQELEDESIEVVESEKCESHKTGATSLRLSASCRFLRGLYHYTQVMPGGEERENVMEFSITTHPGDYAFLEAEPLLIKYRPYRPSGK
jgi:hypothetical protein